MQHICFQSIGVSCGSIADMRTFQFVYIAQTKCISINLARSLAHLGGKWRHKISSNFYQPIVLSESNTSLLQTMLIDKFLLQLRHLLATNTHLGNGIAYVQNLPKPLFGQNQNTVKPLLEGAPNPKNVSRLVLQLYMPNPLKPCVESRMKIRLE